MKKGKVIDLSKSTGKLKKELGKIYNSSKQKALRKKYGIK